MTKDIFEYVKILLPKHKCVAIPNFGAFIFNKEENNALDVGSDIVVPSYSISFNGKLQHDDGILSSYVQAINGTTYEKARKDLAASIKILRAQLLAGKELPCSTLGKLELIEGALIFSPNKDYILPSHYGLSPVGLTTISTISQSLENETKTISLRKRLITVAASAAVVLLLTLPTTTISDNFADSQQAGYLNSLMTFDTPSADKTAVKTKSINKSIIERLRTKDEVSRSGEAVVVNDVKKDAKSIDHQSIATPKSRRTYYMIVGGDTSERRAINTLNSVRKDGFESADIVSSASRYRVYVQTFSNAKDADRAVLEFRKDNPKYKTAWIHSKIN